MVLVSTGGPARLIRQPFGTHVFENYANSRHTSATVSCRTIILPTSSSDIGLMLSDAATSCIRKERQVACQRSKCKHSMVLVSTGGEARLIGHPSFGASGFENYANSRRNSATVSWHKIILTTSSSGVGFRISALDSGNFRKESQIP